MSFLWIPVLFLQNPVSFLWIPVDSSPIPADSSGFQWIPVDSGRILTFLQECEGHREVLHPLPTSLAKTESWLHRKDNAALTTTCACSVAAPAIPQKIVWNPRHPPLNPKPKPSKPKAKKPKNPWIQKRLSSPQPSAQPEDCVDPFCAFSEVVQLNKSTLSSPNSLHVSLTSLLISDSSLCFCTYWLWFHSLLCEYQLHSIL